MDLSKFMAEFAREIKGQFSQYDQTKSVLIVPLKEGRHQTVLGVVKKLEKFGRNGIELSSRVCLLSPEINFEEILRQNNSLCYARFAIEDQVLKVQASALMEQITVAVLKEIIWEIASTADKWEFKLTGQDIQ